MSSHLSTVTLAINTVNVIYFYSLTDTFIKYIFILLHCGFYCCFFFMSSKFGTHYYSEYKNINFFDRRTVLCNNKQITEKIMRYTEILLSLITVEN